MCAGDAVCVCECARARACESERERERERGTLCEGKKTISPALQLLFRSVPIPFLIKINNPPSFFFFLCHPRSDRILLTCFIFLLSSAQVKSFWLVCVRKGGKCWEAGGGPREGDATAEQVASVGFVEKKEGFSPPPQFFFKKNLSSSVN